MILTITLNPAIDVRYGMSQFQLHGTNRTNAPHRTAGGKGLNVTRVITQLGEPVMATGILGGEAGEWITSTLAKDGIRQNFYRVSGNTRTCLAFLHDGKQTEVLESGPHVSLEEWEGFKQHVATLLPEVSLVVMSGSLPKGVPMSAYRELIELAGKYEKKVILDTSGEALREGLSAHPLLVKPNEEELNSLDPTAPIEHTLNQIGDMSGWVIHSKGKRGADAIVHGQRYVIDVPNVAAVNAVGSGDAMIAGLAVGMVRRQSVEETLRLGSATGTLNALEEGTGSINCAHLENMLNQIRVTRMSPISSS